MVRKSQKYGYTLDVDAARLSYDGTYASRHTAVSFFEIGTTMRYDCIAQISFQKYSNDYDADVKLHINTNDADMVLRAAEIVKTLRLTGTITLDALQNALDAMPQLIHTYNHGAIPAIHAQSYAYTLPWYLNQDDTIAPVFADSEEHAREAYIKTLASTDTQKLQTWASSYDFRLEAVFIDAKADYTLKDAFAPVHKTDVPQADFDRFNERQAANAKKLAEQEAAA